MFFWISFVWTICNCFTVSLKQLVKLQKVAGIQKCQEESHFYVNKNVCATISNNRRVTVLWSCFFFLWVRVVFLLLLRMKMYRKNSVRPCQQIVWWETNTYIDDRDVSWTHKRLKAKPQWLCSISALWPCKVISAVCFTWLLLYTKMLRHKQSCMHLLWHL